MSSLRRFVGSRRAAAAVEFALILPVAILLYAGASELSDSVMARHKVETVARTLVDLTSQQPTSSQTLSTPPPSNALKGATLASIMTASGALMAPASARNLQLTISAVDVTNNASGVCCQARVRWTYTQAGTLRPCGVNLTPAAPNAIPSPTSISTAMIPPVAVLSQPQAELIVDVAYAYTPIFSNAWINFSTTMQRTVYALPRTTGQVIAAGPLPTTGTQTGLICY